MENQKRAPGLSAGWSEALWLTAAVVIISFTAYAGYQVLWLERGGDYFAGGAIAGMGRLLTDFLREVWLMPAHYFGLTP